jgi:class 3 adenylate cyclase
MASDPDPTAAEGLERKLTTILSADVAGYSRLMAEDEEATLATFRGHRVVFETLVSHHHGRVFNTAGDAILAEFASAVEAVRCATEIQAALRTRNDKLPPGRRVEFRLGVNLGDVMVQGTDLLGDGVNVAARLQAAAEPGGVCISGSVYDKIRNKLTLSFRSLGEQSFKNIPQPVRTFSISGAEAMPLPARDPRRPRVWRWAAVALALLILAGGYAGYALLRTPPVASAAEQAYAGPICYGPGRNDETRCIRGEGTLSGNRISGRWLNREQTVTLILTGEVSPAGDATIELHAERSDGSRIYTTPSP